MKMISVRQPYAWLIVAGIKDIENRVWKTNLRERVAIHASRYIPFEDDVRDIEREFGITIPREEFQFGGIIGTVEVTGCVMEHTSPWFIGPFGFTLRAARLCAFVPASGVAGRFSETPENFREDAPVNVAVVREPELFQKL